jgi:DNA-binding CsgD family transcriptional regulator
MAPDVACLAEAADALAAALLVLREDGTMLHANAAARALLQDGRDWQLDAEQRVRPARAAADAAFGTAMDTVRAAGTTLRVPLAHTAGARLCRLPGPEGGACTLLLSLPPAPGHANDLPSYASAHALSPTETRVLQRLARGEGSAQAAAALGLRATTVRTHVLALRRKTGHASLAALVQTLARLPPVAPATLAARPASPR